MPKEVAGKIPSLKTNSGKKDDYIVYSHFFGVIGDWYICEISKDRKTAFGFRNISSEKEWEMEAWIKNIKEWGEFSINDLQKLVNEEFIKEKDIRFLIVRDIYWEPIKFSDIDTKEATLTYPGNKN